MKLEESCVDLRVELDTLKAKFEMLTSKYALMLERYKQEIPIKPTSAYEIERDISDDDELGIAYTNSKRPKTPK